MDRATRVSCGGALISQRTMAPIIMSVELAVNYATLICHDAQIAITADNIVAIAKAAGVTVPAYVAQIYANTFAKKNVADILATTSAAAPAAAAAPVAAAAAAKPAAKVVEAPKEESDDDMGMGLFD
eukprot:gene16374-19483_t